MADSDILIGPGRVYYAPVGEANPDESTVAYGAAWGGNWTDVGDFLEGSPVTISMPEEYTEVFTERSTAPKAVVRTKRTQTIKMALAEHSAANLALVLGGTVQSTPAAGGGQKGFSEVTFGSQSEVDLYKWGIEAMRKDASDNEQPVRWFLHRGYIRLSGDTAYAKQNPTGIPIEIKILADGSQSAGEEMGTLQIVTANYTAT